MPASDVEVLSPDPLARARPNGVQLTAQWPDSLRRSSSQQRGFGKLSMSEALRPRTIRWRRRPRWNSDSTRLHPWFGYDLSDKSRCLLSVEPPSTVLFVDDETDLRDLVMNMLLAQGLRVFVAPDGVDALHILRTHQVDLLFTDIVMPGIDGVQLARRARHIQCGLKVLFTTGYVQRATEREAARLGPVLFKPLRHTEIIQEVEAVLGAAA